jgi:branched-chain amino acid transport system substrate-binding protein
MLKADSADPAKYLPELQKINYTGATGPISFDAKGDRKDAEVTIFTMKGGKLEPVAIVKAGKSVPFEEFMKMSASSTPAPATPGTSAASPAAPAPAAEPKK